jgi:purine nucleosidase/pyrimidine-specific ribonucleoside hydrolase
LVIFDDDGSPDGTSALFYLIATPQAYIKSASISFGESHPDIYIQHIGRILDSFGIKDIPLGAGQDSTLPGGHPFPDGVIEAGDGFWGLPLPNKDKTFPVKDASELMIETINQSDKPVTIFVSGPNTNLARALQTDPGIRENIAAVFIMGGAINVPGNIDDLLTGTGNTTAEWNIYADPLAASEVFESGLNLYLVPLDATNQVSINQTDTRLWRSGSKVSNFTADIYDGLMSSWDAKEIPIWDLMTAAIMVNPELCGFTSLHLDVVTEKGPNSGQTVSIRGAPSNVNVCLKPDVNAIKQKLIDVFSQN